MVPSVSPAVPWSFVEVRPGEFEICGEIDAHSAPNLAEKLKSHTAAVLVLDLSGVTFMDSSGLRLVVSLNQHALAGGPAIVIKDPSRPVTRLFEIAGLSELFLTHQD